MVYGWSILSLLADIKMSSTKPLCHCCNRGYFLNEPPEPLSFCERFPMYKNACLLVELASCLIDPTVRVTAVFKVLENDSTWWRHHEKQDNRVLIFYKEEFQQPMSSNWWKVIESANIAFVFPETHSAQQECGWDSKGLEDTISKWEIPVPEKITNGI